MDGGQYLLWTNLCLKLLMVVLISLQHIMGCNFIFEDINNSPIYREINNYDNESGYGVHKLYFSDPSETTSGFFEQKFEFEVREDGCFYVTLNSYNSFGTKVAVFKIEKKHGANGMR